MTTQERNILVLDAKIRENFLKKENELQSMKTFLSELKLTNSKIPKKLKMEVTKMITKLEEIITSIELQIGKNFYISESVVLIERYKDLLNKPITVSFYSNTMTEIEREKRKIIKEYISIAQKYLPDLNLTMHTSKKDKRNTLQCKCGNSECFDMIEDTIYVCKECGEQQENFGTIISYKDIDRVNMSIKYSYDRKIHFRDCLNQYQGKQNSNISDEVYNNLFEQYCKHGLIENKKGLRFMETDKKERERLCSKITKDQINMFLKELGYTKHYENINLLHYNMTGIKPDDIFYLEEKLLSDFDTLIEIYDKIYKNKTARSNFINTQYVLYQFLRRYKHPCKKEDFVMLKTIERQSFHDEVTKVCFEELGWNHFPMF
jgi:hypothetical protein